MFLRRIRECTGDSCACKTGEYEECAHGTGETWGVALAAQRRLQVVVERIEETHACRKKYTLLKF